MTASKTSRRPGDGTPRLARARRGVEELRAAAIAAEAEFAGPLRRIPKSERASGRNLAHYLAVRRHDIRALQDELGRLGLSSLGRLEAHVMASLEAVRDALHRLDGVPPPRDRARRVRPIGFDAGDALLRAHADAALGPCPASRAARIMVTMPSEAADDPGVVTGMIANGMDIARINCAHDGPEVWARMVANLRDASRQVGRPCAISFDLAGPKLRTGPLAPGPRVTRWRPGRDRSGRTVAPARVRLLGPGAGGPGIPVSEAIVARARRGDRIVLADTRGRKRTLAVVSADRGVCECEGRRTAYVATGLPLKLRRDGRTVANGEVGRLPETEQWITLCPGDMLDLERGDVDGTAAVRDTQGRVLERAVIGCALSEVFDGVRTGERVFFDDGRIGGIVRAASTERLEVEIVSAAGGVARLRGEKGINLPDSDLRLPALTAKDIEDLAFVAAHADMVALSFVQSADDVESLLDHLARLEAERLGVILKIETRRAFEHLPELLFAGLRHAPLAVMVARGDLGVEVGFERLSEVQEEILWLAEAAHVPVIWATQVLESLAKGGMPSRAEVTDAAMSSRAECVMLNKGPYIDQTLRFLAGVLERMAEHQHKKSARLRRLGVSEGRPRTASRARATRRRASA